MKTASTLLASLLALAALAAPPAATAANYPDRPITVVVPWGGSVDQITRPIMEQVSKILGQPVVIETKTGASGTIGVAHAAAAKPDGHTLVVGGAGPMMVLPEYRKLPYDPDAMIPIAWLAEVISGFAVYPGLGVDTMAQFVQKAKANPRSINFPSAGYGTTSHLRGELLALQAGVELVHVPYRTNADALPDLISGQVHIMFESIVFPAAKEGRLKLLAMLDDTRSPEFPDVPTMAEAGFPDFNIPLWYALYAPAGTPMPIVRKLNEAVNQVVSNPEFAEKMRRGGFRLRSFSVDEIARHLGDQRSMYRTMLKEMKIELQ